MIKGFVCVPHRVNLEKESGGGGVSPLARLSLTQHSMAADHQVTLLFSLVLLRLLAWLPYWLCIPDAFGS